MKVKIGPYKNWFGPYHLAEKLMFWIPEERDEHGFPHTADRVHKFGEWLAHGSVEPEPEVGEARPFGGRERKVTLLYKLLLWIDGKRSRNISVQIDRWDTWSMDATLGHIVLPMLKQLKDTKHGAPDVDDEDVPERLRPKMRNEYGTDETFFQRWDYVMGEMIFAFETKSGKYQNWESQFYSGKDDTQFVKLEDGNYEMIRGENDTSHWDKDGAMKYQERISNGFRLFGKYYENLWD
jgi:hypothetical protein